MTLRIDTLELREFRGYSLLELSGLHELNVIAGPNAVGKTNIIEGLQLLSAGQSFRKPSWSETISWGADAARLSACFVDEKRRVEHVLTIRGNERVYEVNGKRKSATAVAGTCPCVLFIPDDLQLVKDSSARRRAALDDMGAQLSKNFAQLRSEYRQLLRQRNLLIRECPEAPGLLAAYNDSLVACGARVCVSRWRLAARLAAHFARIYGQLVEGERASMAYLPSWRRFDESGNQLGDVADERDVPAEEVPEPAQVQEQLEQLCARLEQTELRRRTTLVGPHKDEVAFFINGKNARLFASQGQQRTLVLCFKLAQVELVRELSGQPPVLLLDDVMSELDEAHRNALTRFVERSAQTFITTANLGYFSDELLAKAHIIEVPLEGTRHVY